MRNEELWKRKAVEILYRKCFKRWMPTHGCVFGSRVTMKRKEKRQRNSFLFVLITCKCMLFPYKHHHIGSVEHSFPGIQNATIHREKLFLWWPNFEKKIGIKSKYMFTHTRKSSSTHILEIKLILFQTISRAMPCLFTTCIFPIIYN